VVLIGLMAMTAFVIDFGRIWQERRELQTGATAAALAIGEDCALGMCGDERSTAEQYADANATDGAAAVRDVYFDFDPDLNGQTVYVATGTENPSGGNTMGMLFAGIIGFDTASIAADATVAWGTPLTTAALPLIISDCEWNRTEAGWPAGSAEGLPRSSADLSSFPMATIVFLDPFSPDCTDFPPGDAPGAFGWIDDSSECLAEATQGSWVSVTTGAPPRSCRSDLPSLLGEPVLIPYFSEISGPGGTKNQYKVAGHGAFVIAGYRFPGATGGVPGCSAPKTCLTGWFVKHVAHGGGPGGFGGDDRGAIVIKLIG
jgi:hypothetical protein